MEQYELTDITNQTVQEFDFTGSSGENKLAAIMKSLSPEEAAAAIVAIHSIREGHDSQKGQNFKNWFDAAFLPILKDFADITGSRLKIEQDLNFDITATFSSRCGIDITPSEKMMHMVVSSADHISVSKWEGSDEVEFSLIFGFPNNAE